MKKQTYEITTQNKINKWLQISTKKELLQDLEMLNARQFNHIYHEHYKGKSSFEGTKRRVMQYLSITEMHKPSKNVYHFILPKRQLKDAWRLKGGKKNISSQQVVLRVEYLRKEHVTLTHSWVTFTSGISFTESLNELYRQALDKMNQWLYKIRTQYKSWIKIYDIIVKVNRFLK